MGRQESLRMPHHSNLECFLRRTTPTVCSQFLPKSCIQNGSLNGQQLKYFVLGDLWDCYDEWSAFGLGSPILLNTGETAVQYYTPSLSAIEIYTSNSLTSRCMAEEYDGESETTFSSSESEGRIFSRSSSDISDKTLELEEWGNDMGGYWSTKDRLGQLYFQYIENEKPYRREPLFKKINELAKNYPGLKTFKSVDLSPASWISVAWYPIYVIPTLRNPKQAFASFLTYHTITSLSQDNFSAIMGKDACCDEFGKGEVSDKEDSNYTSLPPCGLATYKLQSKVWVNPETADRKRIASLLSGAESWSKQPQFHHHDYEYFRAFSM